MDFESLELFGSPFSHVETYVYYEGRRTFALRSRTWPGLFYIVNTVEEDEELERVTTVLVAVTEERFLAIRSGIVPFREAFTRAKPSELFVVFWDWRDDKESYEASISPPVMEIPERWLPGEGLRLDLKTHTAKAFKANELLALSAAQSRTIFALRVEHEGARITEFPVRNLGAIQVALDGEVEALAREIVGPGSALVREIQPSVLELQAASFVIIMAIDTPDSIVEPTDVTSEIFARMNRLLQAMTSGDQNVFLTELASHGSKVRNRFRDLLTPLAQAGSGISLSTVVAFTDELVSTSATARHVTSAVRAMEEAAPEISHIFLKRATLIGLFLRTKRFDLVDSASQIRYAGYMSDEAVRSANGFAVGDTSYVTARVRIEVAFASSDEARGTHYFLESIGEYIEKTQNNIPNDE
jgi:hypothetical protein